MPRMKPHPDVDRVQSDSDPIRHDWSLVEVRSLFALPFADLILRAQRAHRAHHAPNTVQMSTLLSIKTFCQVQDPQYYSYTEHIPDGPTTRRMQDLAKQTGMVLVVPMYEEDDKASGIYYNTAAVIDADGTYLGKYRKTHIPDVKGFWEKYYFRPGNLGYPVF